MKGCGDAFCENFEELRLWTTKKKARRPLFLKLWGVSGRAGYVSFGGFPCLFERGKGEIFDWEDDVMR